MTVTARKAYVEITYDSKDITKNIAPYLLEFEYVDNESHQADSIQITLEDKDQLWMSDWMPAKGDTIKASIVTENWYESGSALSLPCGTFSVDEVEFSGPPHIVVIKGVSIPTSADIRGQAKTKAWENITLKAIAADIASDASLTLMYESDTNPKYLRIDQVESSDLAFLQTICEKACVALKVTDNKIVIFEERTYEEKTAARTINRKGGDVISFSLKTKTAGTAKAATVIYSDPLTGKTVTGTYSDSSQDSGVTINVNDCPDGEYDSELSDTDLDDSSAEEDDA